MRGRPRIAGAALALSAAAALLILGCGPGGGPGGPGDPPGRKFDCGTEIPDPTEMIVGCLVDEDSLPVRGLGVWANTLHPGYLPGYHAFQVVESTTTDSTGRFSFRQVAPGEYYLTAREGVLRSMPTEKLKLQRDTSLGTKVLLRNGLVLGTLRSKLDGKPLESVLCVVENQLNAVGTLGDGGFALYLPPGRAKLVCGVGRTDMIAASAEVEVVAGETTPLDLALTVLTDEDEVRPPGPTGLSHRYDPATGIVHLAWPPVKAGPGAVRYALRRTDMSIGSHAVTEFTTADTVLADVIDWPKDEDGVVRTRPKLILYTLRTFFPNDITKLSASMISIEITVTPPRFLGPEVEVNLLGDKTTFLVGDTARIVGTWRNIYRENRHLAWMKESDGTALKPRLDLVDTSGADTLVYPCTTSGKFGIRFKVTDVSGAAASALQVLEIETGP